MTIRSKHLAAAFASALSLIALTASTANANYLGLADGNPAEVDIWAAKHPEFGKVVHGHHAPMRGTRCLPY